MADYGLTGLGAKLGGGGAGMTGAATTAVNPLWGIAGAVLPSVLGLFGSDSQSSDYDAALQAEREKQARFEAYGAPYRQSLADLYNDPSAFLSSPEVQVPVQQGTNALMRSLSVQGNPFGSGNALQQGQSYSADQLFGRLGQEKDRLANFGGLANYNQAASSMNTNSFNPYKADVWNAVGAGGSALNNIFNPPKPSVFDQYLTSLMKNG